jgi:hypothetical protein
MSSMCLDGADVRSRLGCQVFLTKEVDGMVAKLPSATRNMYVDGESFPLSFHPFRTLPSSLGATLKGDGEAREEITNDQAPRLELIRAVRG